MEERRQLPQGGKIRLPCALDIAAHGGRGNVQRRGNLPLRHIVFFYQRAKDFSECHTITL